MATKKSVLVFATLVQTSCSHDLSLVSYTFLRAIDIVSTFDLLFAEIKSILMTKSDFAVQTVNFFWCELIRLSRFECLCVCAAS